METANKVKSLLLKATNNNFFICAYLIGSFTVLCVRSFNQKNVIEVHEAQKKSLNKSNKTMKKTMWEWKQQLYAEATTDAALAPLTQL